MKKRFLIPMILLAALVLCFSAVRAESVLDSMTLEDLQRLQQLLTQEIESRQNQGGGQDDVITGTPDDVTAPPDEPAPPTEEPSPEPEKPAVPVTAITARPNRGPLGVGRRSSASAWFDVKPEGASAEGLEYSVSDESVVSVEDGVLTGLKPGNTVLTAVDPVSGKKATVKVAVIQEVEDVQLSPSPLKIFKGKTGKLTAAVSPVNANNKKLTWSSDDPNIAKVNANGVVTGVSAGTTWIKAATSDGSCKVGVSHVTVTLPVKTVKFGVKSSAFFVGDSSYLACNVEPADATDKNVEWTSSNPGIADVSMTGMVTARSVGSCTITATAKDGSGAKGSVTVYVEPKKPMYIDYLRWETRYYAKTGRFALDAVSNCVNRRIRGFTAEVKCYVSKNSTPSVSYHFFCKKVIQPGKRVTTEMSSLIADGLTTASIVEVTITDVYFADGTYYAIPSYEQETITFRMNSY